MKAFTGRKCMRVVAALAIGVGLGGADAPAPYRSPWGVAFTPDGAVLAVTDFTANAVAIIDAASGGVVRSVPLAAGGAGVAWSADGKKLYAVEGGGGCVAEIEAWTWTVARRFEAGFKVQVAGTERMLDCLLCPVQHGGYTTRLFLSERLTQRGQNWSVHNILGREWHTWSWNDVPPTLPLMQILLAHLGALR